MGLVCLDLGHRWFATGSRERKWHVWQRNDGIGGSFERGMTVSGSRLTVSPSSLLPALPCPALLVGSHASAYRRQLSRISAIRQSRTHQTDPPMLAGDSHTRGTPDTFPAKVIAPGRACSA